MLLVAVRDKLCKAVTKPDKILAFSDCRVVSIYTVRAQNFCMVLVLFYGIKCFLISKAT